MIPYPAPPDATALRLEWRFLPPTLRTEIERRCGSPVVEAVSQDSGFSPGFASVLTCEDGSRHFVKAASVMAHRAFADSYREEGRVLAAMPADAPVPRLRWRLDEDWVVLGIEHVECGRNPSRPWEPAAVDSALDALEVLAERLTPSRSADVGDLVPELAGWADAWTALAQRHGDRGRRAEAASLAAEFARTRSGDTLVHTEVRADNLVVGTGGVYVCDWAFPLRGADWIDSVMLLAAVHGDGGDVAPYLAGRPLLAAVDPADVDRLLAVLAGYFLVLGDRPVPSASPYLRAHQTWYGRACWSWLSHRRGWAPDELPWGVPT